MGVYTDADKYTALVAFHKHGGSTAAGRETGIDPRTIRRWVRGEGINPAVLEVWAGNPSGKPLWSPQVGAQAAGYFSKADELFFGGGAGGGKSQLLLGLALMAQRRSIIFRREFTQLRQLIDDSYELLAETDAQYTANQRVWRNIPGGRTLEFGAVEHPQDVRKYQGRAHDFKGFDEITHFTESQYRFLTGWTRTNIAGQRTRIVCTGNPPTDAEGEWVIRYWGAWLDDQHPNPAQPGELRWYATLGGQDEEVESGKPFTYKGDVIQPRSRTFIPARIEDNPIYMATGYRAVLQSLPEPLRSQLLYGKFNTAQVDDVWQVIPTAWVLAAQKRWETMTRPALALRSVGVDVARGGGDQTVIVRLYGNWFDTPLAYPGEATPDGQTAARYVIDALGGEDAPVFVDVIGYGASAYDQLKDIVRAVPVNNAASTRATDRSGRYGFANLRAESYWKLREALDPNSGENIALPPSRQLRIDLCAPRFKIVGGNIALEAKDEIQRRTGRSPDYGDAVVLAWYGACVSAPLILWEG